VKVPHYASLHISIGARAKGLCRDEGFVHTLWQDIVMLVQALAHIERCCVTFPVKKRTNQAK
jgi:hypothetical protein